MPKTKQALISADPQSAQHERAQYELKMFWSLRWFFAIIIATGYLASLTASIIGFALTQSPYFLALAGAPSVLLPAIIYLVPMDERRYQIKLRQIEVKAEQKQRSMEARQKKAT